MSTPYPITELFAWVADDPTGEHGIIGVLAPDRLPMQAVSSRRSSMEKMRNVAQDAAKIIGRPVELRRFVMAEVLEAKQP